MPSAAYASSRAPLPPIPVATERDRAIGDMRAFLARVRPQSQAEALRLLRNAYPDVQLGLRVAACGA